MSKSRARALPMHARADYVQERMDRAAAILHERRERRERPERERLYWEQRAALLLPGASPEQVSKAGPMLAAAFTPEHPMSKRSPLAKLLPYWQSLSALERAAAEQAWREILADDLSERDGDWTLSYPTPAPAVMREAFTFVTGSQEPWNAEPSRAERRAAAAQRRAERLQGGSTEAGVAAEQRVAADRLLSILSPQERRAWQSSATREQRRAYAEHHERLALLGSRTRAFRQVVHLRSLSESAEHVRSLWGASLVGEGHPEERGGERRRMPYPGAESADYRRSVRALTLLRGEDGSTSYKVRRIAGSKPRPYWSPEHEHDHVAVLMGLSPSAQQYATRYSGAAGRGIYRYGRGWVWARPSKPRRNARTFVTQATSAAALPAPTQAEPSRATLPAGFRVTLSQRSPGTFGFRVNFGNVSRVGSARSAGVAAAKAERAARALALRAVRALLTLPA